MKIAIKSSKILDITDLFPKFVIFLDASAPTTVARDENNRISKWLDKSINGFHAVQTISSYRPTYVSFNQFLGISCSSLSSSNNSFLQISIPANFPAINGILYVASDKYILPLPIDIPSSTTTRDFEVTGGTSNILTAIILFSGTPTADENNRIINYLTLKGSNSRTLTNLSLEFSALASSGLYTNPLIGQVNSFLPLQSLNTDNLISLSQALRSHSKISQFPLINTVNVSNIDNTWSGTTNLSSFPLLNLSNVLSCNSSWFGATNLSSFPSVDLSKSSQISYTWYGCSNLITFPAMNFRSAITFREAWRNCKLNSESVDNILISIAAGLANNPTKILAANGGSLVLTGSNNSTPTNINRRESNNWNSWEYSLSQVNESINNITYDFRGGISGETAKNWLAAKGWIIETR